MPEACAAISAGLRVAGTHMGRQAHVSDCCNKPLAGEQHQAKQMALTGIRVQNHHTLMDQYHMQRQFYTKYSGGRLMEGQARAVITAKRHGM